VTHRLNAGTYEPPDVEEREELVAHLRAFPYWFGPTRVPVVASKEADSILDLRALAG
jgi:hypothetical protein